MQRETQTQKGVIRIFKIVFPVGTKIIKVDNEGRKGEKVPTEEDGFCPGASDLIVALPTQYSPHTLFIECKTTKLTERKRGRGFHVEQTKQSPNQITFQRDIEAIGHCYALLPTVEAAIVFCKEWCLKNNLVCRVQ